MTTVETVARTGAPGEGDVQAVARRGLLSVNQVVVVAVLLGAGSVSLAFLGRTTGSAEFRVPWLGGIWLEIALTALTCVAELVAVRLRHADDAVEELTLLDGVVLLNTLVLPLRHGLAVTLAGILLAYLVRRRDRIKLFYNLGVYATASTVAAVSVHLIMPPEGRFDLRLVGAMLVATTAFVAVNLGHMALLLSALTGARATDVIREDASLSALTVIGTVGLTGTLLALAVSAPVLLPFAVLPAAALWYAFGASAAKHYERLRSARVLAYSQVLASGPTRQGVLDAFLQTVREEFEAESALVIFEDGTGFRLDDPSAPPSSMPDVEAHRSLIDMPAPRILGPAELRPGWSSAMVAPLVIDGRPVGAAVVTLGSRARLHPRDLTTLSPLVGSLAVALQNADRLTQLVEETSKLRAVVDQASDGIAVVGADGEIEVWSPAMELLTGVAPTRAVGARVSEVLAAEDADSNRIDIFAEGACQLSPPSPQGTVLAQVIRADGERRDARFSHAGVFEDGLLIRDVVIARDLTAESRVQRMRSDFIATVSHELRTPLTPIKGYAEMLRTRGDAMPPEKRARALDVIMDRAEHLRRLVEDLLAASTLADGQHPQHSMARERADLAGLVARACEDFPASSSRLRLAQPSSPIQVLCDQTRAVQVTSNLISNALKYSSDEHLVDITVDVVGHLGRVIVTDRGRGIPADQLERIFDKFHRIEDPMVMSTSGTGLGLFIARRLARAMDGDITVESTLGAGSRFVLTLPRPA